MAQEKAQSLWLPATHARLPVHAHSGSGACLVREVHAPHQRCRRVVAAVQLQPPVAAAEGRAQPAAGAVGIGGGRQQEGAGLGARVGNPASPAVSSPVAAVCAEHHLLARTAAGGGGDVGGAAGTRRAPQRDALARASGAADVPQLLRARRRAAEARHLDGVARLRVALPATGVLKVCMLAGAWLHRCVGCAAGAKERRSGR